MAFYRAYGAFRKARLLRIQLMRVKHTAHNAGGVVIKHETLAKGR